MKPYTVSLDSETVNDLFCDSETSNLIDATPAPYTGMCNVKRHLVGVCNLYEAFVSQYILSKDLPDLYCVKTTSDIQFYLCTFKNTKQTRWLFDTLESYGMYMSSLTWGINFEFNKIYLTNKLMRDLSAFSPKIQATVIATLRAINWFVTATEYMVGADMLKTKVDAATGKVYLNFLISQVIASFEKVKSTDVEELPVEEYTKIIRRNISKCLVQNGSDTPISISLPAIVQECESEPKKSRILFQAPGTGAPKVYSCSPAGDIYDSSPCQATLFDLTEPTLLYTLIHIQSSKTQYYGNTVLSKNTEGFVISNISDYVENKNDKLKFINKICEALPDNLEDPNVEQAKIFEDIAGAKTSSSIGKQTTPEDIKAMYAEDAYAAQLYAQRQAYYDTFDIETLSANIPGFCNGNLYSLMFTGDSGTGKSTAARVLADRCGFPYASINFSTNLEESDIIGSMIPNLERKSELEPEFVWQDGILTKAVRNGYCIILEELNFARPGVLGKLNSLLDENRQIDLSTGEIVKAHPNFRIIATLNVAYEGTNRLNKALINRFQDCKVFEVPDRAKLIEIIATRCKYKNMKKIEPVLTVFYAVQKFSKESNLDLVVSVRQLLNIFNNGKFYTDANEAVHRVMLNGTFLEDPERKQEFEQTVLSAVNLNYKL